ncbi:MAG: alpha/beta fold hydrolase [Spirochaetota bacterium]
MRRVTKACVPAVALLLLWACATPEPAPQESLLARYPVERPFAESRFSTFGGLTLHYRTWTPAGEPAAKILLLHAEGASTVTYRLLAPRLAEAGYAVVAIDLPGFGFSDTALEFEHTLANRTGVLWSLIDRLDTEPNEFPPADAWVIGGHGMGGQVATGMALERPARTAGLVLFATEVVGTQRARRGFWFPPVRWAWRAWLENSLYTPDGVDELLSSAYGRPATDEEVGLYAAPLVRPEMPNAYVRYARTAGEIDLSLDDLGAPALLIWGELDDWIDTETAAATAQAVPASTLEVVPNAHHLPMETHAAATSEAMVRWIGER